MKRLFDIIFSLTIILLTLPVTIPIALAIKLESKGPIFFLADRVGRNYQHFKFIKFRTMKQTGSSSSSGPSYLTVTADKRVTVVGRILRTFKIDELPQLINVLKGEMSVVGPRPEVPEIVYEHYKEMWAKVLLVKPGLTCLLQIKVFPDFTYHHKDLGGLSQVDYYLKNDLKVKLQEDIKYVEEQSFMLDILIILKTIYCILFKSWKYI